LPANLNIGPHGKKYLYRNSTESLKYKDLKIEIEKMWVMNTTTIPVILGARGVVKKGMEKYINIIPVNI